MFQFFLMKFYEKNNRRKMLFFYSFILLAQFHRKLKTPWIKNHL